MVRAFTETVHHTRDETDFPHPLRQSEARLRLACPCGKAEMTNWSFLVRSLSVAVAVAVGVLLIPALLVGVAALLGTLPAATSGGGMQVRNVPDARVCSERNH